MTVGTALPFYCARCKDEITMPSTYCIVPDGAWRGLYHLGCEPQTQYSELKAWPAANGEDEDKADAETR